MAALAKEGLDLGVSENGDLLVCEGALCAIWIVSKVVLFFHGQCAILGQSNCGVRTRLQECSCEVVGGCCAEVCVVKGEQLVLIVIS